MKKQESDFVDRMVHFSLEPEYKLQLRKLAEKEHRKLSNYVAVIIRDHIDAINLQKLNKE